jgi:hypothetical protein
MVISWQRRIHRIKNKLFHGENFQRVQAALTQLEPIANRY